MYHLAAREQKETEEQGGNHLQFHLGEKNFPAAGWLELLLPGHHELTLN
jgi:hypothetical protein